jgi:hypothetical protein
MAGGRAYTPDGRGYGILFHSSDGTLFVDRGGYEFVPETAARTRGRCPRS